MNRRPSARAAVRGVAIGVVLAGAAGLAGCSGSDQGASADTEPGSEVTVSSPRFLDHPEQVPELIRARFGEVPRFTRLTLTDADVSLELRDPDIPDNLDLWRYSGGTWTSSPVSVSQSEIDELDVTTFGPESIVWEAIPGLIQQAYDGVDLEEEEINSVSFDRIAGDPPRVYIGISGLRGSGSLLAAADGTGVEVRRN